MTGQDEESVDKASGEETPPARSSRRRSWWFVAVAVVMLTTILGVAWFWTSDTQVRARYLSNTADLPGVRDVSGPRLEGATQSAVVRMQLSATPAQVVDVARRAFAEKYCCRLEIRLGTAMVVADDSGEVGSSEADLLRRLGRVSFPGTIEIETSVDWVVLQPDDQDDRRAMLLASRDVLRILDDVFLDSLSPVDTVTSSLPDSGEPIVSLSQMFGTEDRRRALRLLDAVGSLNPPPARVDLLGDKPPRVEYPATGEPGYPQRAEAALRSFPQAEILLTAGPGGDD